MKEASTVTEKKIRLVHRKTHTKTNEFPYLSDYNNFHRLSYSVAQKSRVKSLYLVLVDFFINFQIGCRTLRKVPVPKNKHVPLQTLKGLGSTMDANKHEYIDDYERERRS